MRKPITTLTFADERSALISLCAETEAEIKKLPAPEEGSWALVRNWQMRNYLVAVGHFCYAFRSAQNGVLVEIYKLDRLTIKLNRIFNPRPGFPYRNEAERELLQPIESD